MSNIALETQYKELLHPVKDIEQSFSVNIAELLQTFVAQFTSAEDPNFNCAALLLQGSASIYGKKVEYLYKLAEQLHDTLLNKKGNGQPEEAGKERKERQRKDKFNDPFLSVEFKLGKNLSCLRKKNLPKTTPKKPVKKAGSSAIPVHLLSNDNDDKGEVFYDTRGDIVGNKGDFAMNKCRLISSGWLLLPTVNPNQAPTFSEVPDYYDDSDIQEPCATDCNDIQSSDPNQMETPRDDLQSSPDDGFGSYPPSSEIPGSNPTSEINSENVISDTPCTSTAPPSTDEGIVSTPNEEGIFSSPDDADDIGNDAEMLDPPGDEDDENIPSLDADDTSNPVPRIVRNSVRRALKACQLALEDDPLAGLTIDKELLVRKKIEKKNVRRLPRRLKNNALEDEISTPNSDYCARTFFSLDEKSLHKSLLNFDTSGLDQNSKFVKCVLEKIRLLKSKSLKKKIDPIEDEREIDYEGIENLQQAGSEDDDTLCDPFNDDDIQIDYDVEPPPPAQIKLLGEADLAAPSPEIPEDEIPDISHVAQQECEKFNEALQNFVQNSDITQKVQDWEKSVKPFLNSLKQREEFDINLYGSTILNAFEDNNRKQTMTFRQFCKNKEKWQIHRYFMALLPLANMGNVSLESEFKPDGTEEIFITLLSRKMHHLELEEFGHNDGSHS